ncbi:hypothetical protein LINPERPRIM_LOCUS736 [Linum perenne]
MAAGWLIENQMRKQARNINIHTSSTSKLQDIQQGQGRRTEE